MPKCIFILIVISTKIAKIRTPRLACFAMYNSLAWLIWCGDYTTYNVDVVTAIAECTWSIWISIAVMIVGSTDSFTGSGQCSIVAATLKSRSDRGNWSVRGPVVFAHLQCGLEPRNLDGTNLGSCWCLQHVSSFGQRELPLPHAWKSPFSVACFVFPFLLALAVLACTCGRASVTAMQCCCHTPETSEKGNGVHFHKTLKQGCATQGPQDKRGPGADVLWAVACRKSHILKQALQFL